MYKPFSTAQEPQPAKHSHTLDGSNIADFLTVPEGDLLLRAEFQRSGSDLILQGRGENGGQSILVENFFTNPHPPTLQTAAGARISPKLAFQLAGPANPGILAMATDGSGSGHDAGIGTIDDVKGEAVIIRAGLKIPASKGMTLKEGDIIETGANGSIGLIYADGTTIALGSDGRMVIDEMSYDPDAGTGKSVTEVVQGTFSFVSGGVAKLGPEAMLFKTPVVTIGVKGTTVAGTAGAEGTENSFTLMSDADGGVGAISVTNAMGTQLLNQPNQTTTVTSFNVAPSQPFVMSEEQVTEKYGAVIEMRPEPPAREENKESEPEAAAVTQESDDGPFSPATPATQDAFTEALNPSAFAKANKAATPVQQTVKPIITFSNANQKAIDISNVLQNSEPVVVVEQDEDEEVTDDIVTDTTSPTISSVSVPSNATYDIGYTMDFTVNFSESIVTTSVASSTLSLGLSTGGTVSAAYNTHTDTSITYRYTVQSGNLDIVDGITVDSLSLNSSTITDSSGNPADLTLNSVASTSGVLVDGVGPAVTLSISTTAPSEADTTTVTITATADESYTSAITVNLSFGGTATGSGTDYTVAASSITIAAGSQSGSTTLQIVDDSDDDDNETITVGISSLTNAESSASTQTMTIIDNEPTENVITISSAGQTITFTSGVDVVYFNSLSTDWLLDFTPTAGSGEDFNLTYDIIRVAQSASKGSSSFNKVVNTTNSQKWSAYNGASTAMVMQLTKTSAIAVNTAGSPKYLWSGTGNGPTGSSYLLNQISVEFV